MLAFMRDLVKANKDREQELKPLTVVFWSDFMANPSIMYGLFAPTPRKLNYDPDKVKVMGTKDGMIKWVIAPGPGRALGPKKYIEAPQTPENWPYEKMAKVAQK